MRWVPLSYTQGEPIWLRNISVIYEELADVMAVSFHDNVEISIRNRSCKLSCLDHTREGMGRQGAGSFRKRFLCCYAAPCRPTPSLAHIVLLRITCYDLYVNYQCYHYYYYY